MNENLLKAAFFNFSNSFFIVLKNDKIESANEPFCAAFEFEMTDVLGKPLCDFILPKDQEKFNNAFATYSKVQVQILNVKKKVRMVEWEFQPFEGFVLAKGKDVSEELKHKERFEQYAVLLRGVNESLEKSSHRLFLLQNVLTNTLPYAPDSIVRIIDVACQSLGFDYGYVSVQKGDHINVIHDTNSKELNIIGNVLKEHSLSCTVSNANKELVKSLKNHSFSEEEMFLSKSSVYAGFPLKFKDTQYGTIEFVSNNDRLLGQLDSNDLHFLRLISNVVGRVLELNKINADLEEKTLKLKSKNKELDEFSYIVSHDLKAPLRAIRNLISFINEDIDSKISDQETKDDLRLIDQRATRMSGLIDGILQYSRVGREEVEVTEFELQELITEVVSQLKPMNPKSVISIDKGFPRLLSKELFAYQILANVLSNAIKYNDKEIPLIHIGYRDLGVRFELIVEDNGPGIPQEYREKVFGVFQTLNSRDIVESTGIGLTIVKKLIELMGGTVTIEDSELGGAKFVLNLLKTIE